jgi:hypothetical protein
MAGAVPKDWIGKAVSTRFVAFTVRLGETLERWPCQALSRSRRWRS